MSGVFERSLGGLTPCYQSTSAAKGLPFLLLFKVYRHLCLLRGVTESSKGREINFVSAKEGFCGHKGFAGKFGATFSAY